MSADQRSWEGSIELPSQAVSIVSTSNFGESRVAPVCVVLLHGYGADAWDLFSFKEILPLRANQVELVCPQAPGQLPASFMSAGGRCWFPIDWAEWQRKWRGGPSDVSDSTRTTLAISSIQLVSELLEHLVARGAEKIILGGFSQGGMIALWAWVHLMERLGGRFSPVVQLWLMSTQGLDLAQLEKRCEDLKQAGATSQVSVIHAHGQQDSILQFSGANRLSLLLKNTFASYTWIPFSGGHEIPLEVLQKMSQELRKIS